MSCWIFWTEHRNYYNAALMLFFLIYSLVLIRKRGFPSSKKKLSFIFLLLFCLYNGIFGGISSILGQFAVCAPGFCLFFMNRSELSRILRMQTYIFSIILTPSLLLYFIIALGKVNLPSIGIISPVEDYGNFHNYFFYVYRAYGDLDTFFRFNGPFIEPGHLGMILSFFLYANSYNVRRKEVAILLVALLFTLSLAAYLLCLIGLALRNIKSLKRTIMLLLVLGGGYFYATDIWKGGDNEINRLIFSRLQYDDEKGIVGNNRFQNRTDHYYKEYYKAGKLWIGLGPEKYRELVNKGELGGAGYKIFIFKHGFIGFLLVFLFYLFYAMSSTQRKFAMNFLLLLSAAFLQRAYPLWPAWYITFITGIAYYEQVYNKAKENKGLISGSRR